MPTGGIKELPERLTRYRNGFKAPLSGLSSLLHTHPGPRREGSPPRPGGPPPSLAS